ncbi:MAG: hypothetical protein JRI57_00995 [Deltaproteobacteria bacterium]|nr:hypothetical protein [Deltaproteobacteria bacterium]MBW1952395.1 hypothetical protein [Deltaproteobacteria bacterium]MBW1985906.1 hypothetical protein [Deltaproteobacteria bacterium]MBW2133666.1 hypothetical protein [Deltaproteobacteria bacterium]
MAKVQLTPALREEYQRLFDTCIIRADKISQVEAILNRINDNRGRYQAVGEPLGIPWYFIAVIHNMESSLNFNRHLHNGDPLSARTVHVPAGRPKHGTPPFTWEESAADALCLRGLHIWQDWSLPALLYKLEEYNGWGYRLYHPHVRSPYLWSYSNHYVSGKYVADGRWSDEAVSRQIGAAVCLRRLAELDVIELPKIPSPAIAPEPAEPLLRYSKNERSAIAKELQSFLNTVPGIYVKVDGYPGQKTSDAFKKVTGYYIYGDPRTPA